MMLTQNEYWGSLSEKEITGIIQFVNKKTSKRDNRIYPEFYQMVIQSKL